MGKKLGRSARAEQLSGCGAETTAFSAEASVSECSSTQASRPGIDWWPDGEAAKRDSSTNTERREAARCPYTVSEELMPIDDSNTVAYPPVGASAIQCCYAAIERREWFTSTNKAESKTASIPTYTVS